MFVMLRLAPHGIAFSIRGDDPDLDRTSDIIGGIGKVAALRRRIVAMAGLGYLFCGVALLLVRIISKLRTRRLIWLIEGTRCWNQNAGLLRCLWVFG